MPESVNALIQRCLAFGLLWGALTPLAGGCRPIAPAPVTPPRFRASDEARELSADLQSQVESLLTARCGTPVHPRWPGSGERTSAELDQGADLFGRHCSVCHGLSGDGAGPVSELLNPRPRDFRRGVFKFQSTPYGARPLPEDLRRTIEHGLPGTLMPRYSRLTPAELDRLTDHVILLALRGELERQLVLAAETNEPLTPELADVIQGEILANWREAEDLVVQPLTPQPALDSAAVERGKAGFTSRGCAKCHGEDGRGQTAENLKGGLKDYWGEPVRAADLTTGKLKGGSRPLDLYRRILGGINGTPMPSFRATLWTEPESIWDLTAYVLHLGGHLTATP